jgi:hypothetical protein
MRKILCAAALERGLIRAASIFILAALTTAAAPSWPKELRVTPELLTFADNYGIALALERKCPSWRVDRVKASNVLAASGLPDDADKFPGPLHDRFMAAASKVEMLHQDRACDMAENLFGPNGVAVRGFMTRR